MSRVSRNSLVGGFDYRNQAWYENGIYLDCGHPVEMVECCNAHRLAGTKISATDLAHACEVTQ